MLNGNGNKSSKKINTLCCFFPKVQVAMRVVNVIFGIGLHVRGGCTHTRHTRSHDDQNFSDLQITIFFNPQCSATCALCARELHFFDYCSKEAPSHTSTLENGEIWCTLGESFDKQTLICFKNVLPVQLIHWMRYLPTAKERHIHMYL